jgi:hypothetical protein
MGSGKFGLTYTGYTVNVPQLEADVDREKAKSQGVPLANLYETLQINLGSLYVNDFNRFGRTYQVVAQAEQQFRDEVGDITRLKTRNTSGEMVPIGSLVKVNESFGPDRVFHYNGYLAADISGSPLPPLSSGQGEDLIAGIVKGALPGGFEFEWTDLTFQKIIAGNTPSTSTRCASCSSSWCSPRSMRACAAARHHFDRAVVPALRPRRGASHRGRQQHLHADRFHRADRPRVQKRHPHR